MQRHRAFRAYVAIVTAAGALTVGVAIVAADAATFTGPYPAMFAVFFTLLVVSELRPVKWLRRREAHEVTVSWTFVCALLFSASPSAAIIGAAVGSTVGDLSHRKRWSRVCFNAAQIALSISAGAIILRQLGASGALLDVGRPLTGFVLAAVAACAAIYIVNSVLTLSVVALHQGVPIRSTVRGGIGVNFSTDGILLALAPIMVVVGQRSLVLLPLLLVLAWAVYRSAVLALERQHEAMHDQLTDLPNRRMFAAHLKQMLGENGRDDRPMALLLLDLDRFKDINDRLGHQIGDQLLQEVAATLRTAVRPTDLAARLGGDEFAVLLRPLADGREAERIARRLLDELAASGGAHGLPITARASIGIAEYPRHGQDAGTLMRHADAAMYVAKRQGAGVSRYQADEGQEGKGRLSLVGDLAEALAQRQLVLHYQPKVELETGRVLGAEALVRWKHPRFGLVAPDEFISLAEHTELMGPFTEYVLREALGQCASWLAQGRRLVIAVNASTRNVRDLRFAETVERLLDEVGLDASFLELEITENSVMAEPGRTREVLLALRRLGVSLTIDDFGTGCSSLAHLRRLPVHRIKIDRSFVGDMCDDSGDALIVRSVIELARNLGLETVAEGVEDPAVCRALQDLGCDQAQGYHFTTPLVAEELTAWLDANREGVLGPTMRHAASQQLVK